MLHWARVAGTAALIASLGGGAAAQDFTIRVASPTTGDITQHWMEEFKERVEERSGGRVSVELYPSGQLGAIPATVEGVALGTIEVAAPATGFLASIEPRFQVLDVPGLFDDVEHAFRVYTNPEVRERLATFGEGQGVEPLVVYAVSPLVLLAREPVEATGDLAGLKIRTPGASPFYVEPLAALGASPVSLSLGEVLPGLQNNVIDGVIAGPQIFSTLRFYDVATPLTRLPGTLVSAGALANRQFMDSLGPELEAIVREAAFDAYVASQPWLLEFNAAVEEDWLANGGTFVEMLPEEQEAYRANAEAVVPAFLEANPDLAADYEALKAAADRLRE